VHRAPGIPCALYSAWKIHAQLGRIARREYSRVSNANMEPAKLVIALYDWRIDTARLLQQLPREGAMLVAGLICNYLVKPVDPKWNMSAEEVSKLQAATAKSAAGVQQGSFDIGKGGFDARAALFWAFVGVPLAWGVWKTPESAIKII
jgi:hypothetical protein